MCSVLYVPGDLFEAVMSCGGLRLQCYSGEVEEKVLSCDMLKKNKSSKALKGRRKSVSVDYIAHIDSGKLKSTKSYIHIFIYTLAFIELLLQYILWHLYSTFPKTKQSIC